MARSCEAACSPDAGSASQGFPSGLLRARQNAQTFCSWFLMRQHATEVLARFGYAARGVVYLIIGFFSVVAAFGSGRPSGKKEALRALLSQPAGDILLG